MVNIYALHQGYEKQKFVPKPDNSEHETRFFFG